MWAAAWGLLRTADTWFQRSAEPDAIYACVGLAGTAAALFFTVALLPAQLHYAEGFSVQLLRLLFRDRRLQRSSGGVLLVVLFELGLLFPACTTRILWMAACGALLALALTARFLSSSAGLLDPRDHLVPALEHQARRHIGQIFRRLAASPPPPEERIEELRTAMDQVVATGGRVEMSNPRFSVPKNALKNILADLVLLEELLHRFINRSDMVSARAVSQAIIRVGAEYFEARKTFQSQFDPLVDVLSAHVTDLLRTARVQRTGEIETLVLDLLRDLTIASLATRPLGSEQGTHGLSSPLVGAGKEHVQSSLLEGRPQGAFDGVQALGAVAAEMATRGLSITAAAVASDLARLSLVAGARGFAPVALVARRALAEVFYRTLARRVVFAGYDSPVLLLIETYKQVLDMEAATVAVWGMGDPIAFYDADALLDRSLSSIARVALFPLVGAKDADIDLIVRANLETVERIIDLVERHATKKGIAQGFFANQLYQILLWLIAFVDSELTLDLLVYYRWVTQPNAANRQVGRELVVRILGRLFDWQVQSLNSGERITMYPDTVMHSFLSGCFLVLIRNKGDRLGLDALLNAEAERQLAVLRKNASGVTLSETDGFNMRIACHFLERHGQYPRLRRWLRLVVSQHHRTLASGLDRFEIVTHLKRPLVTFSSELFDRLDKAIFSSPRRA